jgi:aminoglycoside phosphotransferase (APT) family kinase protein
MSVTAKENAGTSAVRPGYGFDEQRLAEWMAGNVEDFAGPLTVRQFKGGQSNPTYLLITPAQCYVLRRKPPGPTLKGAHAVDREARVLTALASVGYPVARVYGLCMDDQVIGSAFYVMEVVEGRIFWDASFPDVPGADRPRYFDAMNEAIARLHSIDPAAIDLADYGRAGNYFERQIARWSRQYLEDPEAGRDPNMDRLLEWLPAHLPEQSGSAIIHGDFRCDNMIFHPTEPRILAVLDWELSTLGDPLADFGYHCLMYHMPPQIVAGLGGADLEALNIPSEQDYIAAYCRRTGRETLPGYDFTIVFNFFRLAAIFHGIRGRAIRGTAASAQARERGEAFPELAGLGWAYATRVSAS